VKNEISYHNRRHGKWFLEKFANEVARVVWNKTWVSFARMCFSIFQIPPERTQEVGNYGANSYAGPSAAALSEAEERVE